MAPEETLVAPVKGPQCSDYAASGPLKQRDSSSRTRVPSEVGLTTSDKKKARIVCFKICMKVNLIAECASLFSTMRLILLLTVFSGTEVSHLEAFCETWKSR